MPTTPVFPWPMPLVSTSTRSKPAARTTSMASWMAADSSVCESRVASERM